MSIKLIASDLDGTFLAQDNSIPENNLKAIKTLKEKNIPFAICTGKSYAISKEICNSLDVQYGIFGNGTQIIDLKKQKEIFHHCLTTDELDTCYKVAAKHNLHIHAYGDNFVITEELKYLDLHNYITYFHSTASTFGKYDPDFNLSLTTKKENGFTFYIVKNLPQYLKEKQFSIFNIVLSSETENLHIIQKELEAISGFSVQYFCKKNNFQDSIIHKEYDYLSIAPKSIGKGYALNILKDYLQVNTSDILSIGDNLNDISLLTNSGIGIAVANAYEPVKQIATYTTKNSASDGGFAESIYHFMN